MEYIEDRTAHGNLDSLFDGISLRVDDGTVMVYSVGAEYGLYKGYKDGKFDIGVVGRVKMSLILVI